MVFQDPYSSLNPRMTVGQMLAEAIRFHGLRQGAGVGARISELLELVRLPADAAAAIRMSSAAASASASASRARSPSSPNA